MRWRAPTSSRCSSLGASRVRDLFDEAKKNAPAIIFIDEIDAVGRKRGSGMSGGHDEREQTLNQLLTEMDGFDATKGVVILAATNRPESLDPALTRPGRFDRRVPVELPDLKGRESILRLHAKKVKLGPDCDFGVVARMTPGASGAELANIVNEAALCAVRHRRKAVTQFDLQEAVDTILAVRRRRTRSSTIRKSASSPTMRSATRWWRPCRRTAPPVQKNYHCAAHVRCAGLHHAGGGRRPHADDEKRRS